MSLVSDADRQTRLASTPPMRTVLSALLLACVLQADAAIAQDQAPDQVIVQRPESRRSMTMSGRVLDYRDGILQLRLKTRQGVLRFPTEQIIEIRTAQTAEHADGAGHFQAGRFAQAAVALEVASRTERRDWVKRDILALLTRCHLRTGHRREAAAAFIRLTDSDPNTHHFSLIPLTWTDDPVPLAEQRQGREWLNSPNLSAQLIGASLLLGEQATREEATKRLEELARKGSSAIVNLARAQQWRTRLQRGGALNPSEILIWRGRISAMHPSLRGGPTFLLGQGYLTRLDDDGAAQAFLWLPLVYKDDHRLAARASFAAAQALERGGRTDEALAIYRETTERFAETRWGLQADKRLRAE